MMNSQQSESITSLFDRAIGRASTLEKKTRKTRQNERLDRLAARVEKRIQRSTEVLDACDFETRPRNPAVHGNLEDILDLNARR